MFPKEAAWIGNKIMDLVQHGKVKNILNIGSSTDEYRNQVKPHINELIFRPLKGMDVNIVHSDIKADKGVDLVGDLTDPHFLKELKKRKFDLILCNNLLEHLENRVEICNSLLEGVPQGGYLIVTVPHRYPYHYDPIDTMYRPDVAELAAAFPHTELLQGELIRDKRTYYDKLRADKKLAAIIFFRSFIPFYKPQMWWYTVSYLPNMFKNFLTTGVVLRKL